MAHHVADREFALLAHEGEFANLGVVPPLRLVIDGMEIPAKNVLGLLVITEPKLEAENGTEWNEGVENAIVSDRPGYAA